MAELRACELLDTPPDPTFDDLVALTAEAFGVPVAALSLIDEHRQWFKARVGLSMQETDRATSFCGHVVHGRQMMVVEDLARDARFSDNPLVVGREHLRFYAGAPLMSAGGHALGVLCVMDHHPRPFTPQMRRRLAMLARQAERQIELHRLVLRTQRAAVEDELTGLASRVGLLGQLAEALQRRAYGAGERVVVAYVDLDRFKPINDSYGQTAGDDVLRATGRRLADLAARLNGELPGMRGVAARLGGDEFALVLCGDVPLDWARHELAARIVDAVTQTTAWEDKGLAITCSCGLAVAEDADATAETLLRDAGIAMHHAKQEGGRRWRVFSPAMRAELVQQVETESELRIALERGDIEAAFQPIVSLYDNTLTGVEALARWRHPQRGWVSPLRFIPCAERTGLIDALFDQVVERALAGFRLLEDLPHAPRWLSLNLSRAQLMHAGLTERMIRHVERAGIDRARVQLEITESLVSNDEDIIRQLHRLRDAGFGLMLDDFGVGASTLSCLHRFPIQWIKVDHHFMRDAMGRRDLAAVLHAIAQLAVSLDLRLVAEGIEHSDHIPMLQAMDIGYGQGYYFSRPLSQQAFYDWCAAYNPKASHLAA